MTEVVVILTATPPRCSVCRERVRLTWIPEDGPAGIPPRADFYVLVRGTSGLFRHLCRGCQEQTGDRIMARFAAPQEA